MHINDSEVTLRVTQEHLRLFPCHSLVASPFPRAVLAAQVILKEGIFVNSAWYLWFHEKLKTHQRNSGAPLLPEEILCIWANYNCIYQGSPSGRPMCVRISTLFLLVYWDREPLKFWIYTVLELKLFFMKRKLFLILRAYVVGRKSKILENDVTRSWGMDVLWMHMNMTPGHHMKPCHEPSFPNRILMSPSSAVKPLLGPWQFEVNQ